MRISKLLVYLFIFIIGTVGTNVYAASYTNLIHGENNQILKKVITIAGSGDYDNKNGKAQTSSFRIPKGLLVLKDGSILVADTKSNMIRKIENGEVTSFSGIAPLLKDHFGEPIGTLIDGPSNQAIFNHPMGLAADTKGNIYVADTKNNAIRKITMDGQVTTIAGDGVKGKQDGPVNVARFNHPSDVAVAKDGTLYVADTLNHVIRKITAMGQVSTLNAYSQRHITFSSGTTLPAGDYLDGKLNEAKFNEPVSIALDNKGNLFVSDSGNQMIRYINFTSNQVSTVAGNPNRVEKGTLYGATALYAEGEFLDGSALKSKFNFPKGIATTSDGGLLIADSLNHSIRYLYHNQVTTIVGDSQQNHGDLTGLDGQTVLHYPTDVAVDNKGNIIIADSYNNKIKELHYFHFPSEYIKKNKINIVLENSTIPSNEVKIIHNRSMILLAQADKLFGLTHKIITDEKIVWMKDERKIEMPFHKQVVLINKNNQLISSVQTDIAPYLNNHEIYVPLRFIAKAAGYDVQWLTHYRTVLLRKNE